MSEKFNKCLVKSPLELQFYAILLFILTTLSIFLLTQGRYGRQETVKGLIRNEAFFRVAADKVGNVLELYVAEGNRVSKGDPLFRIALPWQDAKDQGNGESILGETVRRLKETEQDLEKESELLREERMTLTAKMTSYFYSLDQNIKKIDDVRKDYLKKKKIFDMQLIDYENLLKDKSINRADVEALRQNQIDSDMALKKTIIEKQNLQQQRAEKEMYYARSERELLQSSNDVKRRKHELINELNKIQMQQEYIVPSPVDGVIHDVGILEGDFVDGQSPSMIVKTNTHAKPLAILYLTSSQIGLLDRNEKIFLRVDTFPYENYGMVTAQVVNVSKTPTKVRLDDKESWFRVKLQLNASDKNSAIPLDRLNDGMSVTTSLRQPGQTLMEWLFMPVKKAFKRNPDFMQ